ISAFPKNIGKLARLEFVIKIVSALRTDGAIETDRPADEPRSRIQGDQPGTRRRFRQQELASRPRADGANRREPAPHLAYGHRRARRQARERAGASLRQREPELRDACRAVSPLRALGAEPGLGTG